VLPRSHYSLFHRAATLPVGAALIVPLSAPIAAPPAAAQISTPPDQTVPPNTTIPCTNCVALFAPGGTITAAGPFTLNVNSTGAFTAGANVPANTGGRIALNDGTINNTTTAGGIGATGVLYQAGGLVTGANVNIHVRR